MKIESVTTHDIREGDLILNHGMRLRVDQEIHRSKSHAVHDDERGACVFTHALIENWDCLVEDAKTDRQIAGFIVRRVEEGLRDGRHTEPRWSIQGNGLAHWSRVIEE